MILDLSLFLAVPLIIAVYLLSAWTIRGWGKILAADVWTGLAAIIFFLVVWHFFLPITPLTVLVVVLVGGVGAWRMNGEPRAVHFHLTPATLLRLGVLTLLLILTAALATALPTHYDTGLYHVQTVLWNTVQPITPGLANIHMRFGYNSLYLLFASLFQALPGGATHYTAGVFITLLLLEVNGAWASLTQRPFVASRTMATLTSTRFTLLFLIPLLFSYVGYDPRNLSTDFPVLILGLILARSLLESAASSAKAGQILALSLPVAVLMITFKLSAAVFAAFCLLMIAFFARQSLRANWRSALRSVLPGFGLAVAMALLWMGRGAVLSGYVVYPATATALPVDWRVPAAIVAEDARTITAYARNPTATMDQTVQFSEWFAVWSRTFARSFMPFISAMVTFIGGCCGGSAACAQAAGAHGPRQKRATEFHRCTRQFSCCRLWQASSSGFSARPTPLCSLPLLGYKPAGANCCPACLSRRHPVYGDGADGCTRHLSYSHSAPTTKPVPTPFSNGADAFGFDALSAAGRGAVLGCAVALYTPPTRGDCASRRYSARWISYNRKWTIERLRS